jgi:hypothetical protein
VVIAQDQDSANFAIHIIAGSSDERIESVLYQDYFRIHFVNIVAVIRKKTNGTRHNGTRCSRPAFHQVGAAFIQVFFRPPHSRNRTTPRER